MPRHTPPLNVEVLKREATFPTPRACAGLRSSGMNRSEFYKSMAKWPTPTSHPRTHSPRPVHHGKQLANEVGGQLNPDWVEWLMGLPLGWTRLDGELLPFPGWHEEPPDIPRVTTERKNRVQRLRALGNAVVPQCARFIGERILQHDAATLPPQH